jgi:hypothetical protein
VNTSNDPLRPQAEMVPFRETERANATLGGVFATELAAVAGDVTLLLDQDGMD